MLPQINVLNAYEQLDRYIYIYFVSTLDKRERFTAELRFVSVYEAILQPFFTRIRKILQQALLING